MEAVEIKKMNEAVTELRKTIDKVSDEHKSYDEKIKSLSGLDQEKVENITKFLDAQDELAQKAQAEKAQAEKEKKEYEERVANLENQVIKATKNVSSKVELQETPEFKAFNELIKRGSLEDSSEHKEIMNKIAAEHKQLLRTDVGEQGGSLVPQLIVTDLLRQVQEISPVRSYARVRTTQTKTLDIPVRTTIPTSTYEGEAEEGSSSDSKYLSEVMTAHRQTVTVPITRDMLNFSQFNMQSEIMSDAVIAFAQGEGLNFVKGDGVKKPQGILERVGTGANDIQAITSAGSGVVSLDDVIKLPGNLKQGYKGVYFFNKKTLYALRVEKDSSGNYLWRIGGETFPTQINGEQFVIMQDMPDVAANSLSVGYGDLFLGYNILDALQMELIRDNVTQKKKAIVEFTWSRYNDGRVVLAEAIKILKTKA